MAVAFLDSWAKRAWVHHGFRFAFALAVTLVAAPFDLDALESASYDWRMRLSPRPAPSGHVVLLPIEHETLKRLKGEPTALDWRLTLRLIARANPARVISFVNPAHVHGTAEEVAALADTIRRASVTYGENDLPKTGVGHLDALPPPFDRVPVVPAPKTSDRQVLARDGVTRRLILSWEDALTLHARLARDVTGRDSPANYRGVFGLLDSSQMLIRYRGKGAYPVVRFIDARDGKFDPEVVRGKIVLIGRDSKDSVNDYVTTPLERDALGLGLSQLEMHANVLDTLILDQAPRPSPAWLRYVMTFVIALLTIYVVLSLRPGQGLLTLAGAVVFFIAAATAIFTLTSWMIPVAHPLVAVFVCYYFVIPYRLIIENRRSWEYFQKNRLLTQVEEMKSNFMRLMSHDLKTPLARIQGMADVISKENELLSDQQRLALATISESSEELTDYIGSILSLSRIEAKEVKLHLRSRDVNQLLREVRAKCDYLARRKNIEIVAELEPLFSIRIDEDLIRTVLTNLIENAIKYAEENTRILVTTEESGGELVLQVADQGRGIPSEEVPYVFERFYRASNSVATTPGSGLGLFLAKYFVELHDGRIEVESVVDRGSTFTVRVPMGGPTRD